MAKFDEQALSSFFSDAVWKRLAAKLALSKREVQIVRAMFEDLKESMIARRLRLSPHTVHTYIERLYGKLGVRSRTQVLFIIFSSFLRIVAEPGNSFPPICGNRAAGRCPLNS